MSEQKITLVHPEDIGHFVTVRYDDELVRQVVEPDQLLGMTDENGVQRVAAITAVDVENGTITVDDGQPEMSPEEFRDYLRACGEAVVEDFGGTEAFREWLFRETPLMKAVREKAGDSRESVPVQYAKRGMAKHKERLATRHIAAPSIASASLLMLREATGKNHLAPSTRESRAVLRKMAHEKRKAGG